MIRYSIFVLATLGSFASAIAAIAPDHDVIDPDGRNVTVLIKNSPFPVLGPVIVEECALDDCSDLAGLAI